MKSVFLFVLAFVLSACTPAEVAAKFKAIGIGITYEQGVALADWDNERTTDCLPGHDADSHVECAIRDAWEDYGLEGVVGLWSFGEMIRCESSFDPAAKNPHSSASGLGQHLMRYWPDRAVQAGHPGGDVFNAEVNADVTAWLFATQGARPWAASRHCHGLS